ncbi:MAG: putative bifunctional diguanylate cyclase/phosphodiesterase [Thalassotalea sp.]
MSAYFFAQPFLYFSLSLVFAVLTFLLWFFYQGFGRQYVKLWMLSLLSLSISYTCLALLLTAQQNANTDWYNFIATLLHKLFLYWFVLLFLHGLFSVKLKRHFSNRFLFSTACIVALTAILSVSFCAFDPLAVFNRFYLRESLPAFIFGCAFFSSSLLLLVHAPFFFAGRILMILTAIIGLRYLLFSFSSIIFLTHDVFREFIKLLPYFDLASHTILGFSILIWMQGAERKSAIMAINRAQYLGKHDPLTGVMNRDQVLETLPEAMFHADKSGASIGIFLIDIKRFKFINDSYGLTTGDYILGEIADRLSQSVLLPNIVGRLSGDLFVFTVELYDQEDEKKASAHLHELIGRSYIFDNNEIVLQCRIGYCVYPDQGNQAEHLLQQAQLALTQAAEEKIDTVMYCDGMQELGRHLLTVETELRKALGNNEFVLYFQPQLNLNTNRLEGVEALVRWQHPDRGIIMPGDFLPDIEALNLNSQLDEYVLEKACQKIAQWIKTYQRKINVAVNITVVEFQNPQLVARIQSLLFKYDIPAKCLELEITESVVMTDINSAMNTIVQLQNMGIKVSIDDFGTGYSSLAYLRDLPIDKIKIDRSFIQYVSKNDSDVMIVKAMIKLSHGLGKRVLAEGVEDAHQLELLRNLNCDAVQGFYIAKPLAEYDLVKYLKRK